MYSSPTCICIVFIELPTYTHTCELAQYQHMWHANFTYTLWLHNNSDLIGMAMDVLVLYVPMSGLETLASRDLFSKCEHDLLSIMQLNEKYQYFWTWFQLVFANSYMRCTTTYVFCIRISVTKYKINGTAKLNKKNADTVQSV